MDTDRDQRWEREAAFFDRKAQEISLESLRVQPRTLARYRNAHRAEFTSEYRLMGLGPLDGRHWLDVGCGDGEASVMLALLGARVTGIDISPGAIAVARRRAEANGVAQQCTFIVGPMESASFPAGAFDGIWCYAFLHHVIPDLDALLTRWHHWLAPGGQVMISEPVSLSRALRTLRLRLLPSPDATPDERPLERAELDCITRHFPSHESRVFGITSRAAKRLLSRDDYEHSAAWRRWLYAAAVRIDAWLVTAGAARFASQIVLHARTG